ncbi:hypothetical protein EV05_0452 [Prochlorococcus sp. MIT 0601]|nr:hypothetical protein EV05_0452 [Prochlorococcus sp. MIT 0601]
MPVRRRTAPKALPAMTYNNKFTKDGIEFGMTTLQVSLFKKLLTRAMFN